MLANPRLNRERFLLVTTQRFSVSVDLKSRKTRPHLAHDIVKVVVRKNFSIAGKSGRNSSLLCMRVYVCSQFMSADL